MRKHTPTAAADPAIVAAGSSHAWLSMYGATLEWDSDSVAFDFIVETKDRCVALPPLPTLLIPMPHPGASQLPRVESND